MVPNALMQAFDDGSKTRGSQGLVAAVIESIAAAVVLYEGDLLLSANRSAELLCGVERGALVGRRFSDIVHPEHRERVTEKAMALRLREDVPQSYEFKIVSGDGRERWVEFTTTRLDLEGKPASIGTLNDITDHRRAVTVLLETEQRYAELFENSEEGIFQGAPGGAITQANPSFSRSLGYTSPSELMALITDVSRDMFVDEQCHADLIAELTKHGRIRGFEAQLKRRDGGTVWMSISANALFADDLSLHSYNAFTRDVTQQRTMERQLLQAHKMEAVGRLAGGIAHDFNNILTVILGYSEMLKDPLTEAGEARTVAREIGSAARRASMLTQQLLAFSRQQVVQRKILDVNIVIRGMETMLQRLIGETVELTTALHSGQATVRADPHQLEQVVMNLVVNARDAMPSGGKVTIATCQRIVSDTEAQGSATMKPGRYVEIAVSDSGVGISAELLPLIFEPFFTTKKQGQGTGLGLSTVYGIVEQCGGFIAVDSTPGKGACFRICLPEEEGRPPGEAGQPDDFLPGKASGTLLFVEDEPTVRKVTAGTLRAAGYVVYEAADGVEALALIERLPQCPDLLITDVTMPRMGGRELSELSAARYPKIRVLFVSGYARDAGKIDWLKGRALVSKPFSREEILGSVKAALSD